jgi:uncharacterized protein with HEPN domain
MRRDDAYLLDMLTAARDAISLTSDLTREQFLASQLHQLAIIKLIETIGEAASRVSTAMRTAHPEIPWSDIVGIRNRLVHGYFEVNLDRVWGTLHNNIPELISLLDPLVPPDGGDSQ